jgi:hypothetical protein
VVHNLMEKGLPGVLRFRAAGTQARYKFITKACPPRLYRGKPCFIFWREHDTETGYDWLGVRGY